jgi:hypothetical protein
LLTVRERRNTQALNKVVSEIDAASDVATFITNNR